MKRSVSVFLGHIGALARAITWPEVVAAAVDMGMAATGARSGGLWLLSADGVTVSLARSVGATAPTVDRYTNVPLNGPLRIPTFDAIRSGTPVWIESARQMEVLYPEALDAFWRGDELAHASLPLFAQGRCIGGLAFNYAGSRQFQEDEREMLQLLSWYTAQALERARLLDAERNARAAAEANQRRSDFLAMAGTILSSSLDVQVTLSCVAHAAVPRVADWCIVEIEEERLKGARAVVAHVDPTKEQFVLELSRRFRALGDTQHGIPHVTLTGESELYHRITAAQLRETFKRAPELAELYGRTGLASAMVVPLSARGHSLGAILLVSTTAGRLYNAEDLAMAEELGRRAGISIENARLYWEAQQAARIKDEFLAMLGHELRNPLAPILTALDLMNLRGGETFTRERTIIARQVQHVVRLVDDLLDVSRITRGKIQLNKEYIEVSKVIAAAVEMASPLLEQRSQNLALWVPDTGLPIRADQERFAQAIANLLTNAAKYTEPRGHIAVTASAEGSQVCVRVRDSGIGIAADVLPSIFDLFVQAQGSLDRARGGLGIGLTVVRSIVELHGGTVAAYSAGLGKGSEFSLRVPLAVEEPKAAPAPAPAPLASSPPPSRPWRILVVDDNIDAAQMLSASLQELGCVTQVAGDGPCALAAAAALNPDLALLDLGLPVMDGFELARRLRQMEATTSTRLVALTGYGQASDRQKSREAGFDEHLVKPVGLDTIYALVQALDEHAAKPRS